MPLNPLRVLVGSRVLVMAGLALAALGCSSRDERLEAQADRGTLRSNEAVGTLPKALVDAEASAAGRLALAGASTCDVSVSQLVYSSLNPEGAESRLSAALLVPGGPGCPGPYPLIAYAHATSRDRGRTLATLEDAETRMLVDFFAAKGYAVVATDYIGYGRSAYAYHPYLNASTESTSVIDSIRAARTALAAAQVPMNGRILLAGYSQGGHAALAAQRDIESGGAADIALSATGAMSGPYDLNLTFQQGLRVLPGIRDESGLPASSQLVLGSTIADTLNDVAMNATLTEALRQESVTGWAATAPVLLCGGGRDPTVSFANAAAVAPDLRSRGAAVSVVDVDTDPAYAGAVPPPGTPADGLASYHSRVVPPLCFQALRDRLFAAYR